MNRRFVALGLTLLATTILSADETLPAGTTVVVRTVDSIDSKSSDIGQTFRASLDAPLTLNGKEVARKGSDVTLRIIEASDAGKLKGKSELTIALVSVNSGSQLLQATNSTVTMTSSGKGKGSLGKIGGGAALGGLVGGIVGGGKGAAIGAGAGAGAGAAAAMATGPHVRIPTETVLTFKVQ